MTKQTLWLVAVAGCALDGEPDLGEVEQALGPTVTLRTHFNPTTGDHYLTAVSAQPSGYTQLRFEGRIFSPTAPQPPDTLPLYTWYGAARQDYLTSSDLYWRDCPIPGTTIKNNYQCIRLEGYVHERPVAGTLPLQQWWSGTRADNRTTADPTITIDPNVVPEVDYVHVDDLGFILPPTTDQPPATRTEFRWGTLGGTPSGARGERDLLVIRQSSSDFTSVHSEAVIDDLLFGPSFPNIRDYYAEVSQNRFNWGRTSILGEYVYPDDPDTWGDESNYDVAFGDGMSQRILFMELRGQSMQRLAVTSLTSVVPGNDVVYEDYQNTFALHDVDEGELLSGDYVAFKTSDGRWLRENGAVITADATSSTGAARFRITRVGEVAGTPILHLSNIRLQTASGRYVTEDVANNRIMTNGGPVLASTFRIQKSICPDVERQARAMIIAAANDGYDFHVHDLDHSGTIDSDELTLLIFVATPTNRGGSNRDMRTFPIPGASPPVSMGSRAVASVGDRMSFMTLAHELMHQLVGDIHISSEKFSTMSATIFPPVDNRMSFMLDPWLRIRLGWVEPEIHAFNSTGASTTQWTPDSSGVRPLLVYDPREYDLATRTGEYFLVEFRNNERSGYDESASSTDQDRRGAVVWNVREGANRGASTFAPDGMGGTTVDGPLMWTATDGTFTPRFFDGTTSVFRLRVGATTSTSSNVRVEWTGNGQLRPRIDGGTTVIRAGQIAALDGMFSVDATGANVRFVRDDTGLSTPGEITPPSTTTPWSSSRVYVTVPANLLHGDYRVYLSKGSLSRESNGHRIEVLPPL